MKLKREITVNVKMNKEEAIQLLKFLEKFTPNDRVEYESIIELAISLRSLLFFV